MASFVRVVSAAILAAAVSQPAFANVSWTDWVAATPGTTLNANATGWVDANAVGTMLNGNVTVTYHGELLFNTQVSDNVGTNYWIPDDPYISSTVHNAPSTAEILIQQGGPGVITNTLTFSAPVLNPVLALVSLGRTNLPVEYSFDGDVTILSSGQGFWGGDPNGSLFEDPGNVIRGHEGHGTIQFNGTFSSISWVSSPSEFWHGFQVGAIPEPETYAMLLAGLGLLGFAARRRRNLVRAAV